METLFKHEIFIKFKDWLSEPLKGKYSNSNSNSNRRNFKRRQKFFYSSKEEGSACRWVFYSASWAIYSGSAVQPRKNPAPLESWLLSRFRTRRPLRRTWSRCSASGSAASVPDKKKLEIKTLILMGLNRVQALLTGTVEEIDYDGIQQLSGAWNLVFGYP